MNAADHYRQAFACLPESELQAYHQYINRDVAEAARLVERGRDGRSRCSISRYDVIDASGVAEDALPVPGDRFSDWRCLAVLAMLHAEASFRHGDNLAGFDDLIAITILGRHVGQGIYVSGLAGMAIEHLAVTKAIEVFGRVDTETRHAFAERLGCLPAFPDLAAALCAERRYFRAAYRDKFAAIADEDVVRTVRAEFGLPSVTDVNSGLLESMYPAGDPVPRILIAADGTRAGLLVLADATLAAMDTLARIANRTEPSPSEKLDSLREAALTNPLLADVIRSFDRMRPIWDGHRERFERLRARASGE